MTTANTRPPFAQQAARASFWAPLIALIIGFVTTPIRNQNQIAGIIIGGFTTLMIVVGLVLGIIALFQMRTHGRRGIIGYALTGVIISTTLIVMSVLALIALNDLRQRMQPATPMTKAELQAIQPMDPAATPVINAQLGFRLEIPPGFEPLQATSKEVIQEDPIQLVETFRRIEADGSGRIIQIQQLKAMISPEELPKDPDYFIRTNSFPPGATVEIEQILWNNYRLDMIVTTFEQDGVGIKTLSVQVPLVGKAIPIVIAAPQEQVDESRKIMKYILKSLKGHSNWDRNPAAANRRLGG